jgi:hypothetical protein
MKTYAIATATLLALGGAAHAHTVVALTGDRTLTTIDTETWSVTGSVDVTGHEGTLIGIDVRPADGMLYAVSADGTVMTVDPASGEARETTTLSESLGDGVMGFIDFNPAADRLRIIGRDGTSLRANVDTGEVVVDGSLAYADDDTTADVVAGAYTNSHAGAESTQLLNIDAANGWLVLQDPPNDGVLNPIGETGIDADWAAIDILSDGGGGNWAWMVAGNTVYEVDLETGAATEIGAVDGIDGVRDIAIMPAM